MKVAILSNDRVESEILSKLGKVPKRCGQISDATKIELRSIDRALQRLRKAGKIRLITGPGGGWVLA